MSHVELNQITKSFGATSVIPPLDLAIENRPLASNPKSSEMTALGLVRLIENRIRPLVR